MDHANFSFDIKNLSDAGVIEGLAAGYGNVDAHGEIFAPGAFADFLKTSGRRPAMLLHHNPDRPAGRWDRIEESAVGLHVQGQLAIEASDGREAYALLKAGALTGLSVGFRAIATQPSKAGPTVITKAELFEVSLVSTPSNPITRISAVKGIGNVRDLEDLLREHGFSSRRAKRAANAAFRAADDQEEPNVSEFVIRKFADAITDLDRF